MRAINKCLSLNRLGRGTAAFFLLLSLCTVGEGLPLWCHLILAHTAVLWYNGLNDLCDREVDAAAYETGFERKVLLNGSLTATEVWAWILALSIATIAIFVSHADAPALGVGLFAAGIACSAIYNACSKYLSAPSVLKFVLLDVTVAAPFMFFYASLVAAFGSSQDRWTTGMSLALLLFGGLYGNYIYASKDLSTDAKRLVSLPLLLGAKAEAGRVLHTPTSRAYLWLLYSLWAGLCVVATYRGHALIAVPLAVWLAAQTLRVSKNQASERQMRRIFITLSNWTLPLLVSLHGSFISRDSLVALVGLGLAHIVLNVSYYHDPNRPTGLMLRSPFT